VNENQQAEALAEWLDHGPGASQPVHVDDEVLETIYALRPEYAPPHGVTIEQVLSSLTEGPLLDPAVAEALHVWLASPAGTPPPKSLPVGVVEATYVLRPDLAPALRIGIDDILGELREGPLVAPPVVHLDNERAQRRWWAQPTVVVAAVAATALFFVGPLSNKAQEHQTVSDYIGNNTTAAADAPTRQSVEFIPEFADPSEDKAVELKAAPRNRATGRSVPAAPQQVAQPRTPAPPPAAITEGFTEPAELMATPPPPNAEEMEPPEAPFEDHTEEVVVDRMATANSRRTRSRTREKAASVDDSEAETKPHDNPDAPPRARPLRLDPQIGILERKAETQSEAGSLDNALQSIEIALELPTLTRFDTARLWRKKAAILAAMGRETDAKYAREMAAKLDPTR